MFIPKAFNMEVLLTNWLLFTILDVFECEHVEIGLGWHYIPALIIILVLLWNSKYILRKM